MLAAAAIALEALLRTAASAHIHKHDITRDHRSKGIKKNKIKKTKKKPRRRGSEGRESEELSNLSVQKCLPRPRTAGGVGCFRSVDGASAERAFRGRDAGAAPEPAIPAAAAECSAPQPGASRRHPQHLHACMKLTHIIAPFSVKTCEVILPEARALWAASSSKASSFACAPISALHLTSAIANCAAPSSTANWKKRKKKKERKMNLLKL
jgi:hypothetical protein